MAYRIGLKITFIFLSNLVIILSVGKVFVSTSSPNHSVALSTVSALGHGVAAAGGGLVGNGVAG